MATAIATGKVITVTIDGDDYSEQINSATIVANNNSITVQTLTGPASAPLPTAYELQITAYQDWGKVGSFSEALWAAALTGTDVTFSMDIGTKTLSGNLVPQFPDAGGSADGVLEFSITLPIDGVPTLA
jgi:hypothetical protein